MTIIIGTVYQRKFGGDRKTPANYLIDFRQENGLWKGFLYVSDILQEKTMGMPNRRNAELAIRNRISKFNAKNYTNIPLPIPERKVKVIEDGAPSRSNFNSAGLRAFK